ncbi:hypothetical protein GCM10011608_09900 [Micromonospora sonchi]|uniref:Uncharacterized protein n=1 Tax=Micromonospora sonchi TaxID=1763543 RepID=A0A917TM42_9ACTN|nr:DUF6093 family protein [Micromonospora sonchi]GGM27133.1 hypothetical protein GCM10011608_09900 [Micromonospora sonchi]
MPLPNSRLIHPRFEEHHRPTVEASMTVEVRLSRPAVGGVRDKTTGVTSFDGETPLWQGQAALRANDGGSPTVQADRVVALGGYLLRLPADAPAPQVRDVVDVLGEVSDPSLVGARLRVVDVPRNGLSWQRTVGCDIEQPINRQEA